MCVIVAGDIVALKKLKMEKEREGFPVTSLREINMLLKAKHPNIVHVKVGTLPALKVFNLQFPNSKCHVLWTLVVRYFTIYFNLRR